MYHKQDMLDHLEDSNFEPRFMPISRILPAEDKVYFVRDEPDLKRKNFVFPEGFGEVSRHPNGTYGFIVSDEEWCGLMPYLKQSRLPSGVYTVVVGIAAIVGGVLGAVVEPSMGVIAGSGIGSLLGSVGSGGLSAGFCTSDAGVRRDKFLEKRDKVLEQFVDRSIHSKREYDRDIILAMCIE